MTDSTAEDTEIPFRAEVARKLLHLVALVIPITALLVGRTYAIAILTPLAIIAVSADVLRTRHAGLNAFIDRYLGFMMRPVERPGVGGPVILNGATCVLLSAALLAIFFPLNIGMTAFIVFMISDAAAAIVGRRLGRIKWPRSPRTIEGSLAFVLVGVGLYAVWGGTALAAVVVIVVVGALVEVLPAPFNDNIRVPIVMALVALILDHLFDVVSSPAIL